ncbi:accessory gene regulator B family protein [Vallitaleaceae bacterium 9-2]
MHQLAERFTNKLIEWEIIKSEDKDLYTYGFWQGTIFIGNLLSVVVVGLLFRMLWQALVFTTAYGLLRIVAGGYHARTQRNCYIFSIAMIIVVLSFLSYVPWIPWIFLPLVGLASLFIFILAPVEDANKPLDGLEKQVYKKRSRIILSFLLLLTGIFLFLGLDSLTYCLSISLICVGFMVVLGQLVHTRK